MRKKIQKLTSLFLVLLMVFSLIPFSALAIEGDEDPVETFEAQARAIKIPTSALSLDGSQEALINDYAALTVSERGSLSVVAIGNTLQTIVAVVRWQQSSPNKQEAYEVGLAAARDILDKDDDSKAIGKEIDEAIQLFKGVNDASKSLDEVIAVYQAASDFARCLAGAYNSDIKPFGYGAAYNVVAGSGRLLQTLATQLQTEKQKDQAPYDVPEIPVNTARPKPADYEGGEQSPAYIAALEEYAAYNLKAAQWKVGKFYYDSALLIEAIVEVCGTSDEGNAVSGLIETLYEAFKAYDLADSPTPAQIEAMVAAADAYNAAPETAKLIASGNTMALRCAVVSHATYVYTSANQTMLNMISNAEDIKALLPGGPVDRYVELMSSLEPPYTQEKIRQASDAYAAVPTALRALESVMAFDAKRAELFNLAGPDDTEKEADLSKFVKTNVVYSAAFTKAQAGKLKDALMETVEGMLADSFPEGLTAMLENELYTQDTVLAFIKALNGLLESASMKPTTPYDFGMSFLRTGNETEIPNPNFVALPDPAKIRVPDPNNPFIEMITALAETWKDYRNPALQSTAADWDRVVLPPASFLFEDGDGDGFIKALCIPLRTIVRTLEVGGMDLQNIKRPARGVYEYGGYEDLIPVFEVLGLRGVISSVEYTANYEAAHAAEPTLDSRRHDTRSLPILIPIFNLIDDIAADPTVALPDLLPRLAYALDSGLLDEQVQALLAKVTMVDIPEFEISADFLYDMLAGMLAEGIEIKEGVTLRLDLDKEAFRQFIHDLAGAGTAVAKPSVARGMLTSLSIEPDITDTLVITARWLIGEIRRGDNLASVSAALRAFAAGSEMESTIEMLIPLLESPDMSADDLLALAYMMLVEDPGPDPDPDPDPEPGEEETLRASVISDPHVLAPELIGELGETSEDYIKALNSDRKMMSESAAILDAALEIVLQDKPDVLLISGDLTKDGEIASAELLADRLTELKAALQAQGVDTKIYLVPGNHDVNNLNAKDFSSGVAVDTPRVTPENYKEIFADFGYNDEAIEVFQPAPGKQAGGLSYVARPKEGFTVLAIDSAKYSADSTASGQDIQETGGSISDDLLEWIKAKAAEAVDRGDTILAMQHHAPVVHFDYQPVILKDYLVDDYERVSREYHNAGINYIFTGHMHANDIARLSDDQDTLYDIETGATVTYPSPVRLVDITREIKDDTRTETLNIITKLIEEIDYIDTETGQKITDLTAYGKKKTAFSPALVKNTVMMLMEDYLADIRAGGGIKAFLGDFLEVEDLDGYLVDTILGALGEEGMSFDVSSFNLTVTAEGNDIIITSGSNKLKITEDALRDILIKDLFDDLDDILNDDALIDETLGRLVNGLTNKVVYDQDGVTKTVLDLANAAYQGHLRGEENQHREAWVDAALANIESGMLLDEIVDLAIDLVMHELTAPGTMGARIVFNVDGAVEIVSGSQATVIKNLLKTMLKDLPSALGLLDAETLLPGAVDSFLDDETKDWANEMLYGIVRSMTIDDNYPEDNNTIITVVKNLKDEAVYVESVQSLSNVTVSYGTSLQSAIGRLPGTVKITDTAGEEHTVAVTWSIEGYNGNTAGTYQAFGTLQLPAGVSQRAGAPVKAQLIVTVSSASSGGGNGGGGGGTTTPPPTPKEETINNPDGSVTKRVTDTAMGTVTETTTWPDGSTQVAEKKKDGTITTTITTAGGVRSETVTTPSGATTSQITLPSSGLTTLVRIPVPGANSGTVAVLVKSDGSEEIIRKSVPGNNTLLVPLNDSATIKIRQNAKSFADAASHWASQEIAFVSARELFQGTTDSEFSPNMTMTRAMLVTVLHRLENTPAGGTQAFNDVPTGMYYTQAVAWAVQNGIIEGTDGMFLPDNNITREQIATILYRYVSPSSVSGDLSGFADASSVSSWAQDAMRWAVSIGLFKGDDMGNLNPGAAATRAEVSTILARFITNLAA